jgi:hypothetical protein
MKFHAYTSSIVAKIGFRCVFAAIIMPTLYNIYKAMIYLELLIFIFENPGLKKRELVQINRRSGLFEPMPKVIACKINPRNPDISQ